MGSPGDPIRTTTEGMSWEKKGQKEGFCKGRGRGKSLHGERMGRGKFSQVKSIPWSSCNKSEGKAKFLGPAFHSTASIII